MSVGLIGLIVGVSCLLCSFVLSNDNTTHVPTPTASSYKRVKGRSHAVEKRISICPHKLHPTSQPSQFSHTHRLSTINYLHLHLHLQTQHTTSKKQCRPNEPNHTPKPNHTPPRHTLAKHTIILQQPTPKLHQVNAHTSKVHRDAAACTRSTGD